MENSIQSAKLISKGQLRRLQTLYGQLARHTQEGSDRAARIAWAEQLVGRLIASFSDLTAAEARRLIDTVQGQLGVNAPQQRRRRGRPRLDRDAAHRAGTEGRRDDDSKQITMAGPAEFARIQYALEQLGWNQAQLDAWLRSPRSPLKKSSPKIHTLGDANRVWWALKRMLDRMKPRP
jgi:hypothetical protein